MTTGSDSFLLIEAGSPTQPITEADFDELGRLLKQDCINDILADSRVRSAEYVMNFDAGRGAE